MDVESLDPDAALIVNQLIGGKVIELAVAEREKYEEDLVTTMGQALGFLLPSTPRKSLESNLKGLVRDAIALKDKMAVDRTFFSFIWYDVGGDVNLEAVNIRGSGRRMVCVFPGIRGERSIWDKKEDLV